MGHQTYLLLYISIFIAVCLNPLTHAQTSTEVGLQPSQPTQTNATTYAWSSWGTWSACSRTCGGGVSVQQRHCLPRDPTRWRRSRKRRKLVRSTDRIRRVRNAGIINGPDCPGLARRYHECNTSPCPGPVQDTRAEQCAVYDRRPFRGRFYTWVPYVDGNAPCILNCRPRGQQFYASLALVTDGTPCTKPGYRAICVQGACKISTNTDEYTLKNYYYPINLSDDENASNSCISKNKKITAKRGSNNIDIFFEKPKKMKKSITSSCVAQASDGGVSFISSNDEDGATASYLMKIEIFDMKNLKEVSPIDYWKHADLRLKYYIKSNTDKHYQNIRDIIYNITKQIACKDGCKKYFIERDNKKQ